MNRTTALTSPQLRVLKELKRKTAFLSWATQEEVTMRPNTRDALLRRDWKRVAFEGKWFRGYALTEVGREIAENN